MSLANTNSMHQSICDCFIREYQSNGFTGTNTVYKAV